MNYTNEQIARCFQIYNPKNIWEEGGNVGPFYGMFQLEGKYRILCACSSGQEYWSDIYLHKLILKELSSITDEDAVAVAKMCGLAHAQMSLRNRYGTSVRDDSYSLWISYAGHLSLRKNDKLDDTNMLLPYQFLIERGYNLPLNCLGGKTPIEAGLAISETVNPSLK